MSVNVIDEDVQNIISSNINWASLKNKRVLITGANGFLAAYMVEVLLNLNEKLSKQNTHVIALVRNLKKAHLRFNNYLDNRYLRFIDQDVSKPLDISEPVHFIIHAASQASPKYYSIDPVGTLNANVLGTYNLLDLAVKKKTEAFLFFSSAEIYGNSNDAKLINELEYGYLDPLNIRSCYSESKRMGENMCVSFLKQFGIKTKIIRPFHTYGPKMDLTDGRVFVDFVSDIVSNRDITIKGDGQARRAYCYIADAIIAYFKVMLEGIPGEAYNVGNPENEYSVEELANILVNLSENNLRVIKIKNNHDDYLPSPINSIIPDISKIKDLGWYPKISVQEGFYRTILSYKISE